MKRPARFIVAGLLATLVAVASGIAAAAEGVAVEQGLSKVEAAEQVRSAVWKRQSDSYTLQLVLEVPPPMVNIRDALQSLPPPPVPEAAQPQRIPNWRPEWRMDATADRRQRDSQFIADTVAKLRSLDPVFSGGGRDCKDQRVEVWLLRADGSQVEHEAYNCEVAAGNSPATPGISVSYGYSPADGAQAVAAAIRIGDDFYIEKLLPLAAPAVQ